MSETKRTQFDLVEEASNFIEDVICADPNSAIRAHLEITEGKRAHFTLVVTGSTLDQARIDWIRKNYFSKEN